jgi:hypothetical protein
VRRTILGWLNGQTANNTDLDTTYHFEKCTPEEADVELYRLLNAPPVLYSRRGRPYDNPASKVKHAHRRDRPELDNVPQLGCSSKLGVGSLILHNRSALADDRDWDAHSPAPQYGAIYQYWRRTSKHPSKSGMQNNLRDPTGNYPDSAIFAQGYGKYPPGHPGNTIGLKLGNNQLPPGPSGPNEQAKESRGWFSRSKDDKKKSSAPQKFPQSTSTTSQARNPQPSYARAPRIRPYDPIPPPRRAACHSAVQMYNTVCKSNPRFVNEFETRFHAWKNTWYSSTSGRME